MQNIRHGRFALFRSPATPGGSPTGINSGTDFGTFQVGGFSRFVGVFSTISSLTLQWQTGTHSGDFQVTSSVVINSGSTIFDQINYGLYTNFRITAATSQAWRGVIVGESIR
jgi:hypothetical protein